MTSDSAASHRWGPVTVDAGSSAGGKHLLRQLVDDQASVVVIKDLLGGGVLRQGAGLIFAHYEKKTASRYHNGTLTTIGQGSCHPELLHRLLRRRSGQRNPVELTWPRDM